MKTVGIISDLHTGSLVGLWPEKFRLQEGGSYELNTGQKWLLKNWNDFTEKLKDVDVVILNGDIIDGRQTRSLACDLITANVSSQVSAAYELLKSLKGKDIFLVRGTEYHDQFSGEACEQLGRLLSAKRDEAGSWSRNVLNVEVDGVLFNVSHKIGIPVSMYRATTLDKTMMFAALSRIIREHAGADVVVRSHAHIFVRVEHSRMNGIITPCWQLQTPYQIRIDPNRMLPDIGGVIVEVENGEVLLIRKILYRLPKPSIEKVG